MSIRSILGLLAAICLVPAGGGAQDALPIPVFVTHIETAPLPPLKPEQHAADIDRTRTEMREVAERLRKQHGHKTSAWAPEVWKVFDDAEDLHTLAIARRDYQSPDTRLGLADSVEDLARSARRSKLIAHPKDGAAYSDLEAASPVGWRNCADSVHAIVGFFIRERLDPAKKK